MKYGNVTRTYPGKEKVQPKHMGNRQEVYSDKLPYLTPELVRKHELQLKDLQKKERLFKYDKT